MFNLRLFTYFIKKMPPLSDNPESLTIEKLEEYSNRIAQIKWKLFSSLTYDTSGNQIFNKAYFSVWDNIPEKIDEWVKKADEKIKELEELENQVDNESILNEAQKLLIKSRIQNEIKLLEYHKNIIYLEWEKAGQLLTPEDREKYNQKKLQLEQELYWKPITQIEFRKNMALEKLNKLYKESSETGLTEEEKSFWAKKIQPMIDSITVSEPESEASWKEDNLKNTYIKEENIFKLVELVLQIQWINPDDMVRIQYNSDETQTEVIKKDNWNDCVYIIPKKWTSEDVYNYFDSIWIWQKFKIIKKTSWGNSVDVRKKWDKFDKNEISLWAPDRWRYNLDKVLSIIFDHEIATHVNAWMGNFKNINLTEPDSIRLPIEEWIATINQSLANNTPLSKYYESSKGDILQLFWEVFDDEDLKQAIKIYFKLSKDPDNVVDRFNRLRKWVPVWYKWSRRSDMSYGEWKNIMKELEELSKTPEWVKLLNKYIKVLYSTKLWYDSIKNIDGILDGICNLEDLKPNFPIFAWKIIYWKLLKEHFKSEYLKDGQTEDEHPEAEHLEAEHSEDENLKHKDLQTLLKERFDPMLKDDIRNIIKTNKNITYEQKKLLVQILKIIREDEEFKKSTSKE